MRQKRTPLKTCDRCHNHHTGVHTVINRVVRLKYKRLCGYCLQDEMVEGLRAAQDKAAGR